jgi:hypothetical protein
MVGPPGLETCECDPHKSWNGVDMCVCHKHHYLNRMGVADVSVPEDELLTRTENVRVLPTSLQTTKEYVHVPPL